MEEQAVRSVPWSVLSYVLARLLTIGTTIVLARLLTPADFGLVALAMLVLLVLSLFRDLGLGAVLIVDQELDRHGQGVVLSLLLLVSLLGPLIAVPLAPVAADVLGEPQLDDVIAVLAATLAVGGLAWFYEALLQRELEFRRRFLAQMAQNGTYAVVAILLAALGAGVWSLVAGQVAGALVACGAFVAVAPYRVRPVLDVAEARRLLVRGRGFLAQGGLAFLRQNADNLAIARALGTTPLGLYSLAYNLSDVPFRAIGEPVARVTFPAYARMRARGEDVGRSFLSALRLVALVTCAAGALLAGSAEPLVAVVLGDQWTGMTAALAILGLWAAVRSVSGLLGWLLNSVGHEVFLAGFSAVLLLVTVPAFVVAAELGGIEAVAWVTVGDALVSLPVLALAVQRRAGIAVSAQWRTVRPVVLAAVAAFAASRLVADAATGWPEAGTLAASVAAGSAALLLAVHLADRALLRTAAGQLRAMVRSRPVPHAAA